MNLPPEHLKVQIRGEMINRRLAVPPAAALEAGRKLWPNLASLPGFEGMRTVAAFVSARGEIPTDPLLNAILDSGRSLVLPRTLREEDALGFHRVERLGDLIPGTFGILEPPEALPATKAGHIDLVLVPGTAFDRTGGRIGFGKGFYDRFLPSLRPEVPRIGVGYGFQVLDQVPQKGQDQRVGWLLTDEGLSPCKG
jgi:5-formyltetrahydrofolate cyclo-ligase